MINVIVTGIGGEASESGASRFVSDVLNHKPDLITIDYGLNDRGIGLERAKVAWESMIAAALSSKIPLILLTPTLDQSSKLNDPQDPLNQHAKQIEELAHKYHLALVDSLELSKAEISKGTPIQDLMSQGNHPNRKGHDIVAAGLLSWFP